MKSVEGIERRAMQRARRSMCCLPFKRKFYEEVDKTGVNAEDLCRRTDWPDLVFAPFGSMRAEEHFIWMIKLGILRREVDGQGLTSRVRLTPMGRKIISEWKGEIPRAGMRERIYETLRRHSRRAQ